MHFKLSPASEARGAGTCFTVCGNTSTEARSCPESPPGSETASSIKCVGSWICNCEVSSLRTMSLKLLQFQCRCHRDGLFIIQPQMPLSLGQRGATHPPLLTTLLVQLIMKEETPSARFMQRHRRPIVTTLQKPCTRDLHRTRANKNISHGPIAMLMMFAPKVLMTAMPVMTVGMMVLMMM